MRRCGKGNDDDGRSLCTNAHILSLLRTGCSKNPSGPQQHTNTQTHIGSEKVCTEKECALSKVHLRREERGKTMPRGKRHRQAHTVGQCVSRMKELSPHTHERRPRVPGGFFLAKYSLLLLLLLPLLPFIHAFIHFSEHRAVRRRPLMSRSGRVRLRAQG